MRLLLIPLILVMGCGTRGPKADDTPSRLLGVWDNMTEKKCNERYAFYSGNTFQYFDEKVNATGSYNFEKNKLGLFNAKESADYLPFEIMGDGRMSIFKNGQYKLYVKVPMDYATKNPCPGDIPDPDDGGGDYPPKTPKPTPTKTPKPEPTSEPQPCPTLTPTPIPPNPNPCCCCCNTNTSGQNPNGGWGNNGGWESDNFVTRECFGKPPVPPPQPPPPKPPVPPTEPPTQKPPLPPTEPPTQKPPLPPVPPCPPTNQKPCPPNGQKPCPPDWEPVPPIPPQPCKPCTCTCTCTC